MKLIYISGPYRAKTLNGVRRNIENARAAAEAVWRMGLYALCPHMNTAFMDGIVPDERWLEGDLVMLARCDGILMIGDWQNSEGAKIERNFALMDGKPIYHSITELEAFHVGAGR